MGRVNTHYAYLTSRLCDECVISDSIYMCDFDHRFSDLWRANPLARGITKSPVRIGANVWHGTKVSVLKGSQVGAGSVIGANSVVRGVVAPMSVGSGDSLPEL